METLTQIITLGDELSTMADNAKAWVYTSEKEFIESDVNTIVELSEVFLSQWDSHGKLVKGTIQIIENRFIAIFADTQDDTMCGRAQDASVMLIKELEQVIGKQLMNRMLVAYDSPNGIEVLDFNDLRAKIKQGEVAEDTNFYNGLITSKYEFITSWKTPIKGSWI
jgi:hypothetical protein